MLQTLVDAAAMGGLALGSVALWTRRVSLTARDRKAPAAVTAGLVQVGAPPGVSGASARRARRRS